LKYLRVLPLKIPQFASKNSDASISNNFHQIFRPKLCPHKRQTTLLVATLNYDSLFLRLYLTITILEPERLGRYNDETKGWTTQKSWFDSQQGKRMYLFFHAFRWVVGPSDGLWAHPPSYSVGANGLFTRVCWDHRSFVGISQSDLQIYLFDTDSIIYHNLYSLS
jgi:hypothetical protein